MAVTSPLRHANVNASGHLSFPSLDFWDPQSSKLADIVEEACTMLSSILHTSLPTYHGSLSCLAILLAHHWGRDRDCSHACSACAAMHSLVQQSAILFSSLLYCSAVCCTLFSNTNCVLQPCAMFFFREAPYRHCSDNSQLDALLFLQARLTMIGS